MFLVPKNPHPIDKALEVNALSSLQIWFQELSKMFSVSVLIQLDITLKYFCYFRSDIILSNMQNIAIIFEKNYRDYHAGIKWRHLE